ncbi:GIN domain-containing protein [Winogradskyella immobilis]|nr:DUF2807 domain-containing protein [Winogradskyella immobilis]MCG0017059.1 DUF2807 domain-containing protein [Winogradskyella immobilis]
MMNKLAFTLLLIIGGTLTSYAQIKDRIKGNRDVTIKQTYVDDFESLIINGDFNIEIVFNNKPSIEIEADNNLHDIITFEVVNGVLTFSTSKRITSKKKLLITINYGELLKHIEVNGSTEIRSLTSMELGDVSLKTTGSSRAYLNIKASNFTFNSSGKSKSRLNLAADSTAFILSDDSQLDALINSKISKFDIYQRAKSTIEGDVDTCDLRIDNSGKFFGKNYTIKNSTLIIESNSDATLLTTESITIEASGTTETYLYGEPKIILNKLSGSAKLQKKEL